MCLEISEILWERSSASKRLAEPLSLHQALENGADQALVLANALL